MTQPAIDTVPTSASEPPRSPVTLLNAPVLTAEGVYSFTAISTEEAHALVRERGFLSAIGHADSARLLSVLLAIDCSVNRIDYRQQPGELALVLRLARRLSEGAVLRSVEEIEAVGYSLALLTRLSEVERLEIEDSPMANGKRLL